MRTIREEGSNWYRKSCITKNVKSKLSSFLLRNGFRISNSSKTLCRSIEKASRGFVSSSRLNIRSTGTLSSSSGYPQTCKRLVLKQIKSFAFVDDLLMFNRLWLAGSFEGLCAASITLLYPHLRRPTVIQRNGSLTGEGFNSRIRYNQYNL